MPSLRSLFVSRRRRVLAIAITAGVALPLAADRVVALVVNGQLADRLACAAGLDEPPSVSVGGFTVIDQVLSAHFGEIEVGVRDLRRDDLTLAEVTVVATDVDVDELTAGAVEAEATVGYETLAAGRDVDIGGTDGALVFSTEVALRDRDVPVTVYAEPVLDGDRLTVEPVEVEVMGIRLDRLPDGLTGDLAERELPALPAGLSYSGVTAGDDGLRVTVAGTQISADADRTSSECGGTEQ